MDDTEPKTANYKGQNGDLIPRPMLFLSLKIDAVAKKCKGLTND